MIKVFIVDDHTILRDGLKRIIESVPDFEVVGEAGSAEDAFAHLNQKDFQVDVLLLDIALPGQSGLELLSQLKLIQPSLKSLVLSMYPEDQFAIRVLKAGASGYLTKEAATDQLVDAIKTVHSNQKYVTQSTIKKLITSLDQDTHQFPHEKLSNREFEVLLSIATGKSVTEIGHELSRSVKTISTHRARLLIKMEMRTNAELTRYAVLHNLVQ